MPTFIYPSKISANGRGLIRVYGLCIDQRGREQVVHHARGRISLVCDRLGGEGVIDSFCLVAKFNNGPRLGTKLLTYCIENY